MSERAEAPTAWAELTLAERHIEQLKASAITPAVALARQYRTITKKSELLILGFKPVQCSVPGLLMPMYNVADELAGYTYRPDQARIKDDKSVKYENPGGSTASPDVPIPARKWVVNPDQPLLFTEGVKKGDAAASHELAVVSFGGVWNWRGPEALAALDQIPLKGRTVYLAFDSDWRRKSSVRQALRRLAKVLQSRGANVSMLDLPELTAGQKVGLDDYFANGGNAIDLFRHTADIDDGDHPEDDETSGPVPVLDVLPSAPCSAGAMIPNGWSVSGAGIHARKSAADDALILPTPAIVTARRVDRATGDESLAVAFLDQSRWKSITKPRDVIASAPKIVTLASAGFPVTSNTAAEVVRWIADYLAVNAGELPVTVTSSVLGWQGEAGFLLPERLIVAEGGDAAAIVFAAADAGSQAHAAALKKSGTLEGWMTALRPLVDYERVKFAVCASFAAPLLEVLNCPGFVVDYYGPTSGGKTSTLRIAGSVWGQSDPAQPSSIVSTFQSTRVYRERIAALFNSVPAIVDDTMQAKNAADVQSFLYDVVGGQGRGRGSLTGLQTTASWRTVAIISGENAATGLTEAGGTKARTLTVYGRPFGVAVNAHVVISETLAGIADNHGHAGETFVAWLLANRSLWPEWRIVFRDRAREISERAGGGPVINRVSNYIAVVEMASAIADETGVLPWQYQDISESLLHELAGEARGADVAAEALLEVLSWAGGRAESFYSKTGADEQPPGGWLGRWERDNINDGKWRVIAFTSDNLRKALEANGHKEVAGIIRQWHERGWLETDQGDEQARRMKRLRVGDGTRAWCYVIRQSAETEAQSSLNGGSKNDDA
jgi:Domain of unknown function (DUF927)/Domain of unknown function (DUF3854)/Cch helix turn helix domain